MNATLRDRLILLEQLFLIAIVSQDETALKEFSRELSQLIHHYKTADASGNLDDSTTLVLSRVSQVIQCMLECEDALKDAQTTLISCSGLPLPSDDLLPVPVSTSCPTFTPYRLLFSHASSSGTLGILGHNEHLDACAYRWLMQNMHNPYPTTTQLQIIGDESLTSVAQAGLWFQEARDLTGWTKLSSEFFTGSINATITAAERFYSERDNTTPFCIAFAFSKVKASMQTLFAEHLAPLTSHVGCSAQTLRPVPLVDDSTHFHELLVNEEVEDTTPPPPVAGCKRSHPEDAVTSLTSDLQRPLKRLCAQSLHQSCSRSESVYPSSITGASFKKSAAGMTHASANPATSVQLSDLSFPVGSKLSPGSSFNPAGQRQTDLYDSAPDIIVVTSDPPSSQGQIRDQQMLEGSLLVPFEQLSPSANQRRESSPSSVPNFAWPAPPSLEHPPTESTGASQITVRPDAPVDLSVFDWNSIPNPLVETPISMNQPVSVYVPSSDLAAMNCELPDPLFLERSTENHPLDDLGSLEDFSLLQFPIPTTFPPDVSASPASFSSDISTFASPEMDWSAITDFVNQFTTFSAETPSAPSPSSTFDAAPSTPENPTGSLLPSPHEVNKPISLLDPSIPPSAFLPAEPGIFTDDASSMWSLLCGLS